MDRLTGKVAIITGAAKGLGEAYARLFAQEGAKVILTDVDSQNGERVAREIGEQAEFKLHDVRFEAQWEKLISEVVQKYGKLDILVNNAGVAEIQTPETLTEDKYRFVMAVSADGTIFGCKHAIGAMKASGGGSIVNMTSVAAIAGEPFVVGYSAAKGAVASFTRAVAVYCAQNQLNIRCNSVAPASINTPMVQSIPEKIAAANLDLPLPSSAQNPLGEPKDIAYLVLYLASDESSFVSGQLIAVDQSACVTMGAIPGGGSMYDEFAK